VGTGFAAIQHLQHDTPDIVVTDCAMRGLSGAKLARVIGEIRPDIPVVFMSGYADIEQLRQQLDDDSILLQKPVPVDLLIGHLERLIAR
jgi:CheY-like chemotaxis protein